jgi:hypothetical protein
MQRWFFPVLILALAAPCAAQTPDPAHAGPEAQTAPKQASTLLEAFEHGHFHGHFRSFFMATDNARQLSDYHAWAVGGGLHFASAPWRGFSFGLGGVFNYRLLASDLSLRDPATNAANRYEIGLFDIEDPHNGEDLDRIEELWLRYARKKTQVTLGQQSVQTPFINDQDGRMRPTAEAGAWLVSDDLKHTRIEGGWIWAISPRSTVRWYGVGHSIGIYPQGLNPDGSSSGYAQHLHSAGVGMLGIRRQVGPQLRWQLWNQYVSGIFNTAFAQADYQRPLGSAGRSKLLLGLQYTHQDALRHGGNADPAKAYFPKNGKSNVLSMQAGLEQGPWTLLAAYTRIGAAGRFLAPREWGREPFYTFMQRERIEGSGDTHAATARLRWSGAHEKLRLELAYGHFQLPDIRNAALNKYAFPAYRQLNLDARYSFGGPLKGLRMQLLWVWKGRLGDMPGDDRYVINRVDMHHFNCILNYTY